MTPHTKTHWELWYREKRASTQERHNEWGSNDPHYEIEEAAYDALRNEQAKVHNKDFFSPKAYEYQVRHITEIIAIEEGNL